MTRRPSAVALIAVLAVAACGTSTGSSPAPTAPAAPPAATAGTSTPAGRDYGSSASAAPAATPAAPAADASVAVTIANFAFAPADLTIPAGTTVTWTNTDGAPHSVVSSDGGFANSNALGKGRTYSITFSTAGTFPYVCGIHSSMRATVTVTP